MCPFILYGPPKPAKCLFSLNVSTKMMQYPLIGNRPRIKEESEISPLSLLQSQAAPLVGRRFYRHLKLLLPDTRCPLGCWRHPRHFPPSECLTGGTFLLARRSLVDSARLVPLCPPHCSAPFRWFGDLHGYPTSFWSPALSWMLSTSLPDALPPIRRTPRCPVSSWSLGPPCLLWITMATRFSSAPS